MPAQGSRKAGPPQKGVRPEWLFLSGCSRFSVSIKALSDQAPVEASILARIITYLLFEYMYNIPLNITLYYFIRHR
jgi:hypothetical protein